MENYTIDLREADGYAVTEDDLIRDFLKKEKLDNGDFLFTVIDGDRVEEFQARGTYRDNNAIYAFTADKFRMSAEEIEDLEIDSYISAYDNPIVAIYKSSHFREGVSYRYEFLKEDKKTEAVHGLLKLIWE